MYVPSLGKRGSRRQGGVPSNELKPATNFPEMDHSARDERRGTANCFLPLCPRGLARFFSSNLLLQVFFSSSSLLLRSKTECACGPGPYAKENFRLGGRSGPIICVLKISFSSFFSRVKKKRKKRARPGLTPRQVGRASWRFVVASCR